MTSLWVIAASERGVTELRLRKRSSARTENNSARAEKRRAAAARELSAYFAGRAKSFAARYDIGALRPFTQAVLKLTAKIPYGEVRSYEWVARKLGKPKAARAVGNALARNPVPIIIPCHRVVRTDGNIGGFALGSAWKKRLLNMEKRFVKSEASSKKRA